MGRTVRMVPQDWEHPKDSNGRYIPLMDGYRNDLKEFEEKIKEEGLEYAIEYFGGAPVKDDYMPDWPESERTHLMMYEDCSEGTPISPAFETPEALAEWLADNKASAFGNMTASYEQWLSTIKAGWAPSAICANGIMRSGVEAMEEIKKAPT